ncbi:hypothetical protein BLNAU_9029 [Blattamonas nauphoetae]|uniref:Uncharacterized protein n=1 Tax=Blattamonas nauphoetae TaxID=2049346 RepID=A0ABQ9XX53_9EUKA|nr:hypothetical protein BLNAU_9029 [Blattamonas nauphoetae]
MQTGKLHTRATIPDNSCGTVHTGYDLWSGVYYVNISKINLYDENYTWMTLWTNSTSDLSSDWISISSSPFFQYEKTYYVEEIYNGECRLSFPTGLKFVFPKKQSIFAEYGFVIISCARRLHLLLSSTSPQEASPSIIATTLQ